jgi:hypothetical protein
VRVGRGEPPRRHYPQASEHRLNNCRGSRLRTANGVQPIDKQMTRSIPLVFLVFCASARGPQEHPQPSGSQAQPAAKPTATEPAASRSTKSAEAQREAPCSEKPSQPEKLRDATPGQGVAAEFDKLFETGRFQTGYCLAEVRVNADGTVDAVRLVRPEDADTRVEWVIVRTITSWRYKPAIACGTPVPSTTSVGFFHCPFKAERDQDPGD